MLLLKAGPSFGVHHIHRLQTSSKSRTPKSIWSQFLKSQNVRLQRSVEKKKGLRVEASSRNANNLNWESWKPEGSSSSSSYSSSSSWGWGWGCCSLSEIIWPSAGAFAAMAILGKIDQLVASKGISMSIAPLGAVSAVLFLTPSSPAARKYNMFMAQIGCAAIGVIAFSILGPGWLARSASLAASIAFMIYTRSPHPPAASLPLLFIDGVKMHHLNYWYVLFPGAAGCILLCLIQELVIYLKDNIKF